LSEAGNANSTGRMSTVDLLAPNSFVQLLLILQTLDMDSEFVTENTEDSTWSQITFKTSFPSEEVNCTDPFPFS